MSGGNRGLGREIGRQLAEHGDHVLLGGRDEASAEEAAAELREAGLEASAIQLDVTDPASVRTARDRIESEHGRLDVLVNNAGVAGETRTTAADVDLDSVKDTIETNLFGAWRLTQAMLPLLRASGRGRVVNMSSGMGQLDDMGAGAPAYRLSKAGLNVLTRILANEEQGAGVLVNSVCPGWVRTDMGGRHARSSVEEGADTAVWLAELPEDGPTGGFFRYRERIPW